jgi:membrane fusion protein, multidrug efflux system
VSRRGLLGAGLVVVLVAAAAAWYAAVREDGAVATATTAGTGGTVRVTRQTLVERLAEDGSLGYADPRTVAATSAGMVTALPAEGATVHRGGTLFRVDDEPVTLLLGGIPLYRPLADGVEDGADVRQLEQNLVALGHDPRDMIVDAHFDSDTAAAVEELQEAKGVEQTGTVTGAQFLVLPAAIRVGAGKAAVGAAVHPGAPVYEASSTTRIVTVDVPAEEIAVVQEKAKVTVELPDGEQTPGTVTGIDGTACVVGSGSDAETVVAVTVRLDDQKAGARLNQAPVDVRFVRQERKAVLTLPTTALVALAEGGYAVRVPDPGGADGARLVAVRTGLYADGRVEVSGAAVTEGMSVLVPS